MFKSNLKIIFLICFSFSGCALQNRNNAFFQPQQAPFPFQQDIVYDVGFSSTPMPNTHDECNALVKPENDRLYQMRMTDQDKIDPLLQKAFEWEYSCHHKIIDAEAEAKTKKALEKSKQPKVARVPSLKNYNLPKLLGLPDIFPAKWQDCTLNYPKNLS